MGEKRGAEEIEILFGQPEALWADALNRVFSESGFDAFATVVPPVQSVLAQGYSRTAAFLGQAADPAVNSYITARSRDIASRIVKVNDTTRKQIAKVIGDSINNGETVAETAKALREKVGRLSDSRKVTIARTELQNAYTEGSKQTFKENSTITHLSVIGCEAREARSPQFMGVSTCNIRNVRLSDVDQLVWHPNHTGTLVPSNFRNADGSVTDPGPVS